MLPMNRTARMLKRGFTLIELLVAITISVVLLSILAQVFRLATQATRDANTRISLVERLRALNIRMRQEFGNMLDKPRTAVNGATYEIGGANDYFIFSTATDEDGRPVNVDVKYVFKKGQNPVDGKLIRRRDLTGPYLLDTNGQVQLDTSQTAGNTINASAIPKVNPNYVIGDDQFFEDAMSAEQTSDATVMMTNVRAVTFTVLDPPLSPKNPALASMLNPRTLPAAVQMDIQYGPEVGNTENLEWLRIVFPVYKGL